MATPPSRRPRIDSLERLYVYWLASCAMLLLVAVVPLLLLRGTLLARVQQTNQRVTELSQRLDTAEKQLNSLRNATPTAARPPAAPTGAERLRPEKNTVVAADLPRREAARPPEEHRAASQAATGTPAAPIAGEASVEQRLSELLKTDEAYGYVLADVSKAEALSQEALAVVGSAPWSAPTWARLALLARLLNQESAAEAFRTKAGPANDLRSDYYDLCARINLGRGRPVQAISAAALVGPRDSRSPRRSVLEAAVQWAMQQQALAEDLVASVPPGARLEPRDRLRLARLHVAMEHWDELSAHVSMLRTVPEALLAERDFLAAVALIQHDHKPAPALAILDELSPRVAAAGSKTAAQGGPAMADLLQRPDAYDIQIWRGVALMTARQNEAARTAFDAAARLEPGHPDAYYWRGVLEARADQPGSARQYLQTALATSEHLAPAWELLAMLELNDGNESAAVDDLRRALRCNARRASSQLLISIAHAKLNQRDLAISALREAVRLNPALIEQARQTDVLQKILPEVENAAASAPAPS